MAFNESSLTKETEFPLLFCFVLTILVFIKLISVCNSISYVNVVFSRDLQMCTFNCCLYNKTGSKCTIIQPFSILFL